MDIRAAMLNLPGASLRQVHLHLADKSEQPLRLRLSVAHVQWPALGWHGLAMQWDGVMQRQGPRRWVLNGAIRLKHAHAGLLANGMLRLAIDVDANTLDIDLSQGAAAINAALPLDRPVHMQLRLCKLPLPWLQGALSQAWAGGRLQAGRLSGRFGLDMLDTGVRASGQFVIQDAGLDSKSGTLAAQHIGMSGHLRLDTTGTAARIDLDSTVRAGEALIGPLYATLPRHAVRLSLSAQTGRSGVLLRHFSFTDPDALQLAGSLDLNPHGDVRRLIVSRIHADFPAVYHRYGKTWLSSLGLKGLRSNGSVRGRVAIDGDGLRSFAFAIDTLDLADASGHFGVTGLHGGLDWSRRVSRPATTLAWQQVRFYRLLGGAAHVGWRSDQGILRQQQALRMPWLGGQLIVPMLHLMPGAHKGRRLEASLAFTGISVPALCKVLGWPAFQGTLGGAIPSLHYVGDRFELDGGLSLHVFKGFVDVTRLSVQNLFGDTPILMGDINMRHLDLAAITSVFDVGRISGRMRAEINKLRMQSWQPVAFDARLLTEGSGRISLRAVKNLTTISGGGLMGLQGTVLKWFDSFAYSRIGLRCRLQAAVCHMSGLGPREGGYAIVQGRGLPHLSVIGHETQVSWPHLLSRLKAAVRSGGALVK